MLIDTRYGNDSQLRDINIQISNRLDNPPSGVRRSLTRFRRFESAAFQLRQRATTSEDIHSITSYQVELAVEAFVDLFSKPFGLPRRPCRERNDRFVKLVSRIDKIK